MVVTSLMDDQSILDNVEAENGILAGLRVCVMTISPRCAGELEQMHKKHGSFYVAAPVSGRPEMAATGQLISYLAGAPPPSKT